MQVSSATIDSDIHVEVQSPRVLSEEIRKSGCAVHREHGEERMRDPKDATMMTTMLRRLDQMQFELHMHIYIIYII